MGDRLRFSAVIVARNAADKVGNCLESIKWADEIVAIDGFSTDSTPQICQKYGAKIIQREFEGFDKERNAGIEHSSGDWVLQLDADDVVSEGMRRAIKRVTSGEQKYNAYKFIRQNFYLGKPMRYGGWCHYSAHLLRKGKAYYKGSLHETLIVDGPIGILEEVVEHHPFNSISEFVERQNNYTQIQARTMLKELGVKDEKFIRKGLCKRMRKIFWKSYVKKKGYREGMIGFIFSVLYAWLEFAKWAKYWKLCKQVREKRGCYDA